MPINARNRVRRWPVAFVALCLLAAGASACTSTGEEEERDTVSAAWLPIMQTMPFYVALEEGLFEERGIEIQDTRFENPNQIVDALVADQVDFGAPGAAAGILMLAEARFPGTFKIFGLQGGGNEVDRINDGLIVREDSDIQSFADLRGKTIGTVPGIQWKTITRHIVRESGLDPDVDVSIVEVGVPVQVAAVINGDVDATLSLEPIGSVAESEPEARRAMVNPAAQYIADPFYSGASVLTQSFIEERPDVARRVVEALDEATAMINEDFDSYKDVLPEYAAINEAQLEVVAQPHLRSFADLNEQDLDSYQALVDIFFDDGVLTERIDVRDKVLSREDIGM